MNIKGLFINGKPVIKQRTYDLRSPYHGGTIATISMADQEDVNRAIDGAQAAFEVMKEMHAYQRSEILLRVVRIFEERKEELARVLVQEAGKPIRTARGEIDRTIATYQLAAEEAKRIYGETIPMDAAPG
ncbi:aldehyde dehydrogenase family protein, partial [Fictibacillus sp. NRS-1165]|uniref:aldehyde dehydrogenase family protein n=1 Tax=Fictibacillus sp. NRS-1165 TaxID=3144463 RepID=UPI003D1D51F5